MPKKDKLPSNVGYVYVLHDKKGNRCKIGKTRLPLERYSTLRGAAGLKEEDCEFYVSDIMENHSSFEKQAHNYFNNCKISGEWFLCSYNDVVNYIKNNQEKITEERINELEKQDEEHSKNLLNLVKYIALGGLDRDLENNKSPVFNIKYVKSSREAICNRKPNIDDIHLVDYDNKDHQGNTNNIVYLKGYPMGPYYDLPMAYVAVLRELADAIERAEELQEELDTEREAHEITRKKLEQYEESVEKA